MDKKTNPDERSESTINEGETDGAKGAPPSTASPASFGGSWGPRSRRRLATSGGDVADKRNQCEGSEDRRVFVIQYTRAQAIEDGVLIDVSKLAAEGGFIVPVALTVAVHQACVSVPEEVCGQDETGRLWDLLQVLRFASKSAQGDRVGFDLLVRGCSRTRGYELRALCHPGDNFEPVITVMFPDED